MTSSKVAENESPLYQVGVMAVLSAYTLDSQPGAPSDLAAKVGLIPRSRHRPSKIWRFKGSQ
jgi:hypothetical protein